MKRALTACVALLGVTAACNPWDSMPLEGETWLGEALWDPEVVSTGDGVYVRLPRAGDLLRVAPDGSAEGVDLGNTQPTRMVLAPDGETLLVFSTGWTCDTEDEDIETVEQCRDVEGEGALGNRYFVAMVRGGGAISTVELPVPFNAVDFTSDGNQAVIYLDYRENLDLEFDGLLNLTEVLFFDLASGVATAVPVGFSADRILFTPDDSRAIVLSRSQVVVVELTSGAYEDVLTAPLTLDVDDNVTPLDAALTPDGRYVLITIQGAGDLYILDLEQESINIVSLSGAPAAMGVDIDSDQTALVYSDRAQVDLLEHTYFSVETLALEEPATGLIQAGGFSLLYNASSSDLHDVYRLDMDDHSVTEFRMENPVTRLELAPDESTAVAFLRPEKSSGEGLEGYTDDRYGVSILDVWSENVISLVTGSEPLGLAFSGLDEPYALVLLDDDEDLLQLDLATGIAAEIRLEQPPLDIGAYGDGRFFITHDTALGMITFLDPASGDQITVADFAVAGILDDDTPLFNPTD